MQLFFKFFVKFYQVILKIVSKYWSEWFLLGRDFIILEFLLSNVLEIYFEIPQIFYRLSPKFNVKFHKNFLNLSSIFFFQNFTIFLEYSKSFLIFLVPVSLSKVTPSSFIIETCTNGIVKWNLKNEKLSRPRGVNVGGGDCFGGVLSWQRVYNTVKVRWKKYWSFSRRIFNWERY